MKLTLHKTQKIPTPETQEYRHLGKIKWLNLIAILSIVCIFAGSLWFVYTNIYQTIGKVQTLLITNPNLSFEPIDFKLYNDTLVAWQTRQALPTIPQMLRDPFNEPSSTTSTPTNTTASPAHTPVQGQL